MNEIRFGDYDEKARFLLIRSVELAALKGPLTSVNGNTRGVVIFPKDRVVIEDFRTGCNHPPCPKPWSNGKPTVLDIHAEEDALSKFQKDWTLGVEHCVLLHAKVNRKTKKIVPSGPPSCVNCAKHIAWTGLYGVFLFHGDREVLGNTGWTFYPAQEFVEIYKQYDPLYKDIKK